MTIEEIIEKCKKEDSKHEITIQTRNWVNGFDE